VHEGNTAISPHTTPRRTRWNLDGNLPGVRVGSCGA
jgi:hypothetical protein